ncbi:MAG: glycosyltransferase family 9 protein [Alphaproteobacteria bacterium]|nr:glycosyltransferase family 9 protein [Alphaproteobacteria bacterium]
MLGRKQTNILVIKTDGLAAFVAAEPAFDAIRKAHPDAKISLLTNQGLQRIARASPFFDQVAVMPNLSNVEARKELVKQLKSAKFEAVYDMAADEVGKKLFNSMGVFRPKWHVAASAPRKKGKSSSSICLPDIGKLLSSAGLDEPTRLPDLSWAFEARKDSANMKPSWYGISTPFGLMLPGVNPEKRWPASCYAGFATIMARSGFMPVLAGPRELHSFGDEIAQEAPQLVDLTGKTDHLQLAALSREATFFVSDDAEEMHLVVSTGCEGVLVADAKSALKAPDGRHVVTLRAGDDLGAVEPLFAWRTLSNMGLVLSEEDGPKSALSR